MKAASWIALHQAQWQLVTELDGVREESFTQRFKHFVRFVKPPKKYPVILTLDGRYSHSRNIEVTDCARENGVHIVCLPPVSTLKLQLLDVPFFQPLKTNNAQEIQIWLKNHSVLLHTIKLLDWLGKAYLTTATAATAANGFRNTGLFPCNIHVFDERDPGRISAQQHQFFA
jgi:hypothetical protein